MTKLIKTIKALIPTYVVIPLIVVFSYQSTVYFCTKLINANLTHYDLTTKLDTMIPVLPSFSIIYLGCYAFWVLNYMLAGKVSKEHFYRFVTNILLSYTLCGIIFIIFPTMIIRPDAPAVTSLGTLGMNFVFNSDTPVNLFPSMHCLISWFCYLGVRNKKQIPKWYQYVSLIIAVLVCISTVTIKQHFIADIFGGIIIAEVMYYICMHSNLYKPVYRVFESINDKLHLN
ncbi:PAP2 family protein [Lachnospiraceae bacterium KM106-2]|nr:PAP2 family protein [Lachnospiraceae bacterium KM106-2]